MKMNKFFAAALAATALFASCAKEEQPVNDGEGEGARVILNIEGTAPHSRALGTAGTDPAALGVGIWDATIFIIDANGAVITKEYLANGDLEDAADPGIETTTAAKRVIVLANVGSDLTSGAGKLNVPTLEALKAVAFSLNEAVVLDAVTTTDVTNVTNRILLQGQNEADLTFTDGEADAGTVYVFPVPSRLNVTVLNRMTKGGTTLASATDWTEGYVKFEQVSVLYSGAQTYGAPTVTDPGTGTGATAYLDYAYQVAVPTFTASTPFYVSGYNPSAVDEWGVLVNNTTDNYEINALATGNALSYLNRTWAPTSGAGTGTAFVAANDFQGTFYALPVVENASTEKDVYPTITVVGTYDQDGAGTVYSPVRRFWHIKMSATDAAQLMKSANVYNITITLSGDILSGGGGIPDPDDEVVEGVVTMTITAGNWQATTAIDKEIN